MFWKICMEAVQNRKRHIAGPQRALCLRWGTEDLAEIKTYRAERRGMPTLSRAMVILRVLVTAVAAVGLSPLTRAEPAAPKPAIEKSFTGELPANVRDLHDAILLAARSGDIAELKGAIEWNELPPDFGDEAKADPIAFWKKMSADGQGREVLAEIVNMLSLAPARLHLGKDAENTHVYVWPYLAERPPESLTPAEEVDLLRLVSVEKAKAMREKKAWSWWRLAISADGTWLTFKKF